MMKSVPASLAAWKSLLKTPLVVVFWGVALISFLMEVYRLVILYMVSDVVGVICVAKFGNHLSGGLFHRTKVMIVRCGFTVHHRFSRCVCLFPMSDIRI